MFHAEREQPVDVARHAETTNVISATGKTASTHEERRHDSGRR